MFTTQSVDVAIIGNAMVGLASAIGLAQQGLQVALIGPDSYKPLTADTELRVSAINHASQALLESLGVWPLLDHSRVGCYQSMQVWQKDGLGAINFDELPLGQNSIGAIIENQNIVNALWQRAEQLENLTIMDASASQIAMGEREAWLTLSDAKQLTARLVLGADGANSWLRQSCNVGLTFWDYQHHGLVATIKTELPHQGCARQAFLNTGPLAFLPLNDSHHCSIVWSLPPQLAQQKQALTQQAFERSLHASFDGKLGLLELVSERQSFPLRMRYAKQFAGQRFLLLGDAAHTIHPLAGQGVNLGFADVADMLLSMQDIQAKNADIGDYRQWRPWERKRKAEATKMISLMEVLKRTFAIEHPVAKGVLAAGMKLVDKLPGVKPWLLSQALGKRD
ncbi:FAD-dependent monooxygenase [Paraferrimonas sp. SM1919]|uniref:FAD-dependent monooxygenase n=1 Tax=Paraferrimonas sp. SM1919 TaxID=2662263 RepID=UPI0013D73FE1|nr:FAD-dependent monooxygenase [Paraferrimonas sp. SM1919]